MCKALAGARLAMIGGGARLANRTGLSSSRAYWTSRPNGIECPPFAKRTAGVSDSSKQPTVDGAARRRRRGRRRARARTFDSSIPSPCIAVCQIDDAIGCCIGCFRAIDEIRDWPILTADEKQTVLERVAARRQASRQATE